MSSEQPPVRPIPFSSGSVTVRSEQRPDRIYTPGEGCPGFGRGVAQTSFGRCTKRPGVRRVSRCCRASRTAERWALQACVRWPNNRPSSRDTDEFGYFTQSTCLRESILCRTRVQDTERECSIRTEVTFGSYDRHSRNGSPAIQRTRTRSAPRAGRPVLRARRWERIAESLNTYWAPVSYVSRRDRRKN